MKKKVFWLENSIFHFVSIEVYGDFTTHRICIFRPNAF